MEARAKDYRKAALESMKGNTVNLILVYIVLSLISSFLAGTGFGFLAMGLVAIGGTRVYVATARGAKTDLNLAFKDIEHNFLRTLVAYILETLLLTLWSMLFVIPGIIKAHSYALTYYIMNDEPDIDASEAIKKSCELMKGHKWELFCLRFSFIGWYLLSFFTIGILAFWIAPYQAVAEAHFYERIIELNRPKSEFDSEKVAE